MAKLKVMCARSMHRAAEAIAAGFTEQSGHEVAFDFGTVGALQAKLEAGETADVLILSRAMIEGLQRQGAVAAGSQADVAKTFIAVCIRAGNVLPDIASPEAFKHALETATAVAMSDPAVGGSAAVYIPGLFQRLGIAAAMKSKSLLQRNGVEVARRVAEGKADIGLTLSGEVASVEGAVIVGPIPAPYGQETVYSAGVSAGSEVAAAARDLIAVLTATASRKVWREAGFEPPG